MCLEAKDPNPQQDRGRKTLRSETLHSSLDQARSFLLVFGHAFHYVGEGYRNDVSNPRHTCASNLITDHELLKDHYIKLHTIEIMDRLS